MSASDESILIRFREDERFCAVLERDPGRWWLMPIAEGKWSPGEIIAHLIEWDRVPPNQRLDQLRPGENVLTIGKSGRFNAWAARRAREEATLEEVLASFHHTRTRLLKRLESVPGTDRDAPFSIRNRSLTLTDYLKGLADHDEHHRKQIEAFLRTHAGSWAGPRIRIAGGFPLQVLTRLKFPGLIEHDPGLSLDPLLLLPPATKKSASTRTERVSTT